MQKKPPITFISDNRSDVALAAAKHLLTLGYRVVLNNLGGKSIPGAEVTNLRLTDSAALSQYFKQCDHALHAVIHPAPPPIHASVEAASDQQWRDAFAEGALASLTVTRTAGGQLAALGRGTLIFLGSIHAEKPMGHGFLFSIGCSATQMLCREAALDLGAKGVNCFYIQRGIMGGDLKNRSDLSNLYHATSLQYPRKRLPKPDSLNKLLAFLLTDGAGPLNGADLRADEGLTLFYGHQRKGGKPT